MAIIRSSYGSVLYEHVSNNNPNPYQQEHDELFGAIRNGHVINDTEFGAKSTMAAVMGRTATYTGQQITWEQIMSSQEDLVPDIIDWDNNPPVMPDEYGNYPVPKPGVTQVI